jgi:quinol monooxygenase YgiN
MITHIVCWKYCAEVTDEQRNDHIERLRALSSVVPGIDSFSVGADVLHLDRSFDTGLVAVYRDMAALQAYTNHPEHQKVAELGKTLAERAVSVDFES